ncbi:MAG: FAD-dependent oxidoreductase, partial [Gammaproteobacteria bacterium]|nr:FAD-dependent oxidoreductase [Gammaproteobacteria bacterium]
MPTTMEIAVPDIGDFSEVEVIEVLVAAGDRIEPEQPLMTLESDKASMDIPAPRAGVVRTVRVAVGDRVSEGDVIVELETEDEEDASKRASERPAPVDATSEATGASDDETVTADVDEEDAGETDRDAAYFDVGEHDETEVASASPTQVDGGERGERVDLVVIGAGPGGYTAAFRAADLGLKTVLIDRRTTLGGVCLNVGCIPSKALLHTAEVITATREMRSHGLDFGEPSIDLQKLAGWKDGVVGQLTKGLAGLARQRGVEVITGAARFESPHALAIQTGSGTQHLAFEHAIVAVGSEPVSLPGFPNDDERLWDSTDALKLGSVPRSLLVIGGG